jgi:hypothetical protein
METNMSLLQKINENANPNLLEQALLENIQELEEFVDTNTMSLEQLEKGFDAARRGLSLAHRLPEEQRKKHFSRILTNMNKLRAGLARMIRSMESDEQPEA